MTQGVFVIDLPLLPVAVVDRQSKIAKAQVTSGGAQYCRSRHSREDFAGASEVVSLSLQARARATVISMRRRMMTRHTRDWPATQRR